MDTIKISEDTNPALSARIDQAREAQRLLDQAARLPGLEAQQAAEAEARKRTARIEQQRSDFEQCAAAHHVAVASLLAASDDLLRALAVIRAARDQARHAESKLREATKEWATTIVDSTPDDRPKHPNDTYVTAMYRRVDRISEQEEWLLAESSGGPLYPTLPPEIVEILNR